MKNLERTVHKIEFKVDVIRVFVLLSMLLLFGCDTNLCDEDRSDVFTSPNKSQRIVLIKESCGATTSYTYKLYVLNKDGSLGNNLLVADKVRDLKIKWLDNYLVQLSYKNARVFSFKNFFYPNEKDLNEIKLILNKR